MKKLDNLFTKNLSNVYQNKNKPDQHKYLSQTQEAFYTSPKNLSDFYSSQTLQNQNTPYISFPKDKRFFNPVKSNTKHYYPVNSTLVNMQRNFGKGEKFKFGVHPLQLNPLLETPPPTLYAPKTNSDLIKTLGKFSASKSKIQKRYCPDNLLPSIELAFFREGPSPLEYQGTDQATSNDKPKYHFGEKGKMFNEIRQAYAPNSEYDYYSKLTKETRFENCSITFGKGQRSKQLVCQNKNPGPADYQNYEAVSHFLKYNPQQSGVKYSSSIDKIHKAKEYSKKLSIEHSYKYNLGNQFNKRDIQKQLSLVI